MLTSRPARLHPLLGGFTSFGSVGAALGKFLSQGSVERLYRVDQFCRNISSIIIFSGLPKVSEHWVARSLIQVQWLALKRDELLCCTDRRCSSWLQISVPVIPAMAWKH
jgi:hypothetical protein